MSLYDDKVTEARANGYTDSEIGSFIETKKQQSREAGYTDNEINKFLGVKEPDEKPISDLVDEMYAPGAEEAKTRWDEFVVGVQKSSLGLGARQGLPSIKTPQEADFMAKTLESAGMFVGDIPATVAGFVGGAIGGAAAGTAAAPGPGTVAGGVVGAGAGSAAVPTAIRETLMDAYMHGNIKDFGDFWTRFSGIAIKTGKSAITGAIAAPIGGAIGGKVLAAGAAPLVAQGTAAISEAVAFSAIGSGLEGQVPDKDSLITGALFAAGLHGSGIVAGKVVKHVQPAIGNMADIYAKNGMPPWEVVKAAARDPQVKQEVLAIAPSGEPPRPMIDALTGIIAKTKELAANEEGTLKLPQKPEVILSDSEKTVLSRLGENKEPNKLLDVLQPDKLYQQLVDELGPLKKLAKETGLSVEESPATWADQTYASGTRAGYMVRHGVIDFKTLKEKSSDSVIGGMEKAGKAGGSYEGMNAYKLAKTAIERHGRGVETGIDLAAAHDVVAKGKDIYEKGWQETQRAKDGSIDYLADSGILSTKAAKGLKEANAAHAPLKRVLDVEFSGGNVGRGLRARNPIKEAKGSELKIVDPTKTEVENIHLYTAMADRNRAMGSLVDVAEKNPVDAPIAQVKRQIRPIELQDKEVSKFLEEHGIDAEDLGSLTIFRALQKSLGKNEAVYFRNGKPEVWEFKDPDVAQVFRTLEPEETHVMAVIAEKVASFKRAGITAAPDFAIRGTIKDQPNVAILTDTGFIPFYDWMHGAAAVWKKDADFKGWMRNGGMGAAMVDMDVNFIQRDIHELFDKTGTTGHIWNTVKHPVEAMQVMQEFLDSATRVGVDRRLKIKNPGMSDIERAQKARTASLNFSQRGSLRAVQALSRYTPFLRPSILGLEQLAKAVKERPGATLAKGMAYITAPSTALWLANYAYDQTLAEDDPQRYQNLPRWQRDNYWILPPINDVRLRIPKPQVTGIMFGSTMERFLDYVVEKDPRAFKDFDQTLIGSLVPPLIPAVMLPIGEAWANKSTFSNKPLIPSGLEGASGYMQYTANTSEVAKKLSQYLSKDLGLGLTEISPIIIENYVSGWLGSVGIAALHVLDAPLATTPRAATTIADVPFVKSFIVRNPSMSAAPIQDFYDKYTDFQKRVKDVSLAASRLNEVEMQRSLGYSMAKMDQFAKTLSAHAGLIRSVAGAEGMTDVEKRQYTDSLYSAMLGMAKGGLSAMENFTAAQDNAQ